MFSIVWIFLAALLLMAAVTDARVYRIPNWACAAIAALFVATAPFGMGLEGMWPNLAVGIAVFAVGYALYALTGMGAGDAKLAAAIGLWVGPGAFQEWITLFALAMLFLVFLLVGMRRMVYPLVGAEPSMRVLKRGAPVPLGVALSASAIVASPAFAVDLWIF
jgi:prepilin peptidase CpaA